MMLGDNIASDELYDVAIVGFGPSGAALAGLLGGQGLKTFVCDKSHEVYELPRAFALDHEIMRVFQQLGIAQDVLAFAEPFTPSEFYGVDGQLIKRFTTAPPPYPLGHVPSLVFTQPPVERLLRAQVRRLPSVDVALGCEFVSLSQDADAATLRLRTGDGSLRQVRARYVVACDGAASPVRRAVGIELRDLGFDQPWLVVDVLVNERGLARLPRTSVQYCEPKRPCTYLIGPKNHRRWEISINEGEDPAALATPGETWKLLSRWLSPDEATLWRQASYRFHALVAEPWRAGRVFVAGDAAHQQPPFLGQGMCQGIRDACNLSWKLGAVLKGRAEGGLLDSYGVERQAHVTALTTRIKAVGQLVGERDVDKARERDGRLLAECGGVVKSVPRQDVQPPLAAGVLSPAREPGCGTIFPQPWLIRESQAVLMDGVAGAGWRLVIDASAGEPPALPRPASDVLALRVLRVGIGAGALPERDGVLADWFKRHGCAAALVRPDHYVYGTAQRLDDVARLLESAASAGSYRLAAGSTTAFTSFTS